MKNEPLSVKLFTLVVRFIMMDERGTVQPGVWRHEVVLHDLMLVTGSRSLNCCMKGKKSS